VTSEPGNIRLDDPDTSLPGRKVKKILFPPEFDRVCIAVSGEIKRTEGKGGSKSLGGTLLVFQGNHGYTHIAQITIVQNFKDNQMGG
jgi:hypothetical protein